MKIFIAYAKSTAEVSNRQAALGSYIYCLAGILVENGYEILVNGIPFSSLQQNQYVSASSPMPSHSFVRKAVPRFLKRIIQDLKLFRNHKQLYRCFAKNEGIDLVLEFYSYGSDLGYRLSKKWNIPLLVVYDAPVLDEYKFFNKVNPFFESRVKKHQLQTLERAKRIVVYSNPVKKFVEEILNEKKDIRIHQNIDFTRFEFVTAKPASPPVNIGFIGSFLKWHRVDMLLEAFEMLCNEGISARLFLIGKGMEWDNISKKVEQSKWQGNIVMPGFTDGKELENYKRMLHIGVMPSSNWYGAPVKIFEYGAAKMAVIAPSTPTVKDLFENGKNILLTRKDSVEELYAALKLLCIDATYRDALAGALQELISSSYSKERTLRFYNSLLKE